MANTHCRECGESDPAHFGAKKAVCKPCDNATSQARYHERRERNPVGLWASTVLRSARKRAKKRGLEFSLTAKWLFKRYTGVCEVTGVPMIPNSGPYAPSLDRIDSSGGYTRENTRIGCYGFNVLRSNRDDDEHVLGFLRAAAPQTAPATCNSATKPPGD